MSFKDLSNKQASPHKDTPAQAEARAQAAADVKAKADAKADKNAAQREGKKAPEGGAKAPAADKGKGGPPQK